MKQNLHSEEVEYLLGQMTLPEKVALLSGKNNWATMPIERLNLSSIVVTDGPHGVRTGGQGSGRLVSKATAYPTGISMASTWNRELIRRVGIGLGEETRHLECHILLGPCVNIVRSPLGGRNFETYSEDPYLAGQIGIAYVKGLQSQGVGASVKHFAANNQEYERFRGNSVVDERTLREIYLPAFESIVKEGHPWTVMCSYNRVNGDYASENEILLRKILKEEWGFEGVVVSDWNAVHDIFKPIKAGLDLEMPGPARYFGEDLVAAVNNWQLDEKFVDEAAQRILRLLFWTGVIGEADYPEGSGDTKEHRALAREVAAESMVLLKNENQILPLDRKSIKKLAVIGLNADQEISGGGSSRVDPPYWVTPLQGLRDKLGDEMTVEFTPGYDNRVSPTIVPDECLTHLDGKTPGLETSLYNNMDLSGEPTLVRVDSRIQHWWSGGGPEQGVIDPEAFSIRWRGMFTSPVSGDTRFFLSNTGTSRLWIDGELLLENAVSPAASSNLNWDEIEKGVNFNLEKDCQYDLQIEYESGKNNMHAFFNFAYLPSLNVEGDLLTRAVDLAKQSDAAVVVVGFADMYESEGHDRPNMDLPGGQDALVKAVAEVNKNTVVVVNVGAPVAMPWVDLVDGILLSYYPGQEGGHALADILFGDVNPSGKLTVSYPKRLEDNPAYLHYPGWKDVQYGEGLFVGYRYYDTKDVEPAFPFGHGLSYTGFLYSEIAFPGEVFTGEDFKVSVTIENTGQVPGKEVVQLYVRDVQSTLIRPYKELKGFEKVQLKPGETQVVEFSLTPRGLSYYDPYQKAWVAEVGEFEVLVGASSRDIRLQGRFELKEATN
ncbi:MAG: glycoside hydrolase family 3 C-terminal domain-containing protein [Brevefilum sp.]|nr:glycoside hydrolase family 3 C-terminal domain-containing protein [Brevefilum sp.]MDT8382064.1 glycoside hydrolase family 3 C-terminal domain-containing protein [Brevefilum sp.]MDW7755359.1 glycoside hydrolase family 3 C-terminal domain-containing protein [Brevefilum sp.]